MAAERVLDPSLIMRIFDNNASDPDTAPSDDSSDHRKAPGTRALSVPEHVPDISTVKCQQSCTVNVF